MKTHKKILKNDGIYYPLFNLKGLRSSITPYFGGDLKLDHHHYALKPTTQVDLFNDVYPRHVIIKCDGKPYFLNGQTEIQQSDELFYETGLFYQKVLRRNNLFDIEVTSFVPLNDMVETHHIKITNQSRKALTFEVTTAIQLYGRSADNLRDHRQVTSLLNQVKVVRNGILLYPSLSFDERGHQANHTVYSTFVNSPQSNVKNYIPLLDDIIDGGSIQFPNGLHHNTKENTVLKGYEACGGVGLNPHEVKPNESFDIYFNIGISQNMEQAIKSGHRFLEQDVFDTELKAVKTFFEDYQSGLDFHFYDEKTSEQLKMVTMQPLLRRYFGNSYLPHHDYGKGGRGWRDLWQDLLALIMMNDDSVYPLLLNNFAGVRLDGTNATIIGDAPGEFKADRNSITRVWSDHGAWPLITTMMYLDETGDLEFLLKKQTYFKDQFTHYTHKVRKNNGANVETINQKPYEGTILEHLLLQNLVAHHHTGFHGYVKLEDADWNDGLDMASNLGETIAFTHMYASNLKKLSELISKLEVDNIVFFSEMDELLKEEANLNIFFDQIENFSGQMKTYRKKELIQTLDHLYQVRLSHLHKHAFQDGRYQSYINNLGFYVDNKNSLNLTGQTMALLSETATLEQAKSIAKTTKDLLFEANLGGYHLNTDYQRVMMEMGRAYGFAYNHKENGAVFAHMAVMYAYGLYQYLLIDAGHEAFMSLLLRAQDPESKVLAGIPEYFSDRGIGMYPYLTGSASWMLKLLRTEVFGIQMVNGKLNLNPKLKKEDFIDDKASITTFIFKQKVTLTYFNSKHLDFGQYNIDKVIINQKEVSLPIVDVSGNIEVYLG